eukprot:TRINITY_DN13666_c0_g1_i2.p1 TRINITY_DN13666_c0_g1~~TRINITY_DN13666_c0_g1_i2.p1  ORF type:complete len:261 (+),score=69.27 TRINITY_DN13666_c0_g1_i2:48-830(+)
MKTCLIGIAVFFSMLLLLLLICSNPLVRFDNSGGEEQSSHSLDDEEKLSSLQEHERDLHEIEMAREEARLKPMFLCVCTWDGMAVIIDHTQNQFRFLSEMRVGAFRAGFYNVTPYRRELVLFFVSLDGPILSVVCDLSPYWAEQKDPLSPQSRSTVSKMTGTPPPFTVPYRGEASDKRVLYGAPSVEYLRRVVSQLEEETSKCQSAGKVDEEEEESGKGDDEYGLDDDAQEEKKQLEPAIEATMSPEDGMKDDDTNPLNE